MKVCFNERIHRREYSLHQVIQQVRKADGKKYRENSFLYELGGWVWLLHKPPLNLPR